MQEEIKSRLNSGNACYHSVQSLLSSHLLSRNVKVKIYKTIILPVVLYGCETWSLILRKDHRLRVFENRALRRIFGAIRQKKSRILRWVGHVACMGHLGSLRCRWDGGFRMDLREIGRGSVEWIKLAQGPVVGSCEHGNERFEFCHNGARFTFMSMLISNSETCNPSIPQKNYTLLLYFKTGKNSYLINKNNMH
jgi:hypothetical protein